MQIKSSADLRNSYKEISELAKASGEPIYITINGSGDGVFMSMEAFEQMEEKLLMRSRVLAAENARQAGAKTYTQEEVDERFRKRYEN
ncbi:MAG: type II toxin-antitoxin system Phd/YefM family antitoxin [Hungatella hathewayi]|uniref:type II toxin-antitoxin system Phd/YefM family antitoxin n=1 Tax=Hungatella hathewayi TaxID=154046 RepID=UPI00290AA458|nr:type II toxin-antitoxin system Phd/YefM family antitoxin [Hungatella hathewayi]